MIRVTQAAQLIGHHHPIFSVENSGKNYIVFTAGEDKGIVEWSLKTMQFIKVLYPTVSTVYAQHSCEFLPYFISGDIKGNIQLFDFEQQKLNQPFSCDGNTIFDIKSSHLTKLMYAGCGNGEVHIWSLLTFEKIFTLKVADDAIRAIAISPDQKFIAFGCRDNKVYVYSILDLELKSILKSHTLPVFSLQFTNDSSLLFSGSRDAQLKVWDLSTFSLKENIPAHLFAINSIALHPTKPYFATASMDKSIKIWGLDDFNLYKKIDLANYPSHRLSINKIVWNSFQNQLISISDDKLVMVWDVEID